MKTQSKSRFKTPNKNNFNPKELISEENLIIEVIKPLPKFNPDIISCRGKKRNELLPPEYKNTIALLEKNIAENDDCTYIGRVWILFGVNSDQTKSPINVGQTTDLFGEISKIIWDIMIKQKGPYYEEINNYDSFKFFELKPENIISSVWGNENQLIKLAYDMVKDYYAEVLLAYVTSARNWNSSVSGVDKRFLEWLEKENSDYAFDSSRKGI